MERSALQGARVVLWKGRVPTKPVLADAVPQERWVLIFTVLPTADGLSPA